MTKYDYRNDMSRTQKICKVHYRTAVHNRSSHRLCILIFSQQLYQSSDKAKLMWYRSYVILRRYLHRYLFRGTRSNAPMENANPDAKDANSTELKATYKNIRTKRLLLRKIQNYDFVPAVVVCTSHSTKLTWTACRRQGVHVTRLASMLYYFLIPYLLYEFLCFFVSTKCQKSIPTQLSIFNLAQILAISITV